MASKYRSQWETGRPWLKPIPHNNLRAQCTLCKADFSISGSGLGQVKIHEQGKKHSLAAEQAKSQSHLANNGTLLLPKAIKGWLVYYLYIVFISTSHQA